MMSAAILRSPGLAELVQRVRDAAVEAFRAVGGERAYIAAAIATIESEEATAAARGAALVRLAQFPELAAPHVQMVAAQLRDEDEDSGVGCAASTLLCSLDMDARERDAALLVSASLQSAK